MTLQGENHPPGESDFLARILTFLGGNFPSRGKFSFPAEVSLSPLGFLKTPQFCPFPLQTDSANPKWGGEAQIANNFETKRPNGNLRPLLFMQILILSTGSCFKAIYRAF